MSECVVCLRIRPEEVLRWAHLVFSEDGKVAREVGLEACDIMKQSYVDKPTFLCGRGSKCALAGLFYLLGVMHGAHKTQRDLSEAFAISDVSVRTSYLRWLSTFPQFFPGFSLIPLHSWGGLDRWGFNLTFKEERVNKIPRAVKKGGMI